MRKIKRDYTILAHFSLLFVNLPLFAELSLAAACSWGPVNEFTYAGLVYLLRLEFCTMSGTQHSDANKRKSPKFNDVFQWVQSFGCYQKLLYSGVNLILIPVSLQFMLLVFGMGTPKFHCTTPNSTCPASKCCENCTSYEFDGPFKSAVSEVSFH